MFIPDCVLHKTLLGSLLECCYPQHSAWIRHLHFRRKQSLSRTQQDSELYLVNTSYLKIDQSVDFCYICQTCARDLLFQLLVRLSGHVNDPTTWSILNHCIRKANHYMKMLIKQFWWTSYFQERDHPSWGFPRPNVPPSLISAKAIFMLCNIPTVCISPRSKLLKDCWIVDHGSESNNNSRVNAIVLSLPFQYPSRWLMGEKDEQSWAGPPLQAWAVVQLKSIPCMSRNAATVPQPTSLSSLTTSKSV